MDITKAIQILAEAAGITEEEFQNIFESIEVNHIVRSSNPNGELKIWLKYNDLKSALEFRKNIATYVQFGSLIQDLDDSYSQLIGTTIFSVLQRCFAWNMTFLQEP